jgi:trimeric autotransporter adhesin
MAYHTRFRSGTRPRCVLSAVLTLAVPITLAAQPCEPHWSPRFHAGAAYTGWGRVTTVEGPSGPLVLIAAGGSVGSIEGAGVVAYDGATFFPLAGGLSGQIRSMIRGNSGMDDLYIAAAPNLAVWNRSSPNQWQLHPIGNVDIRALLAHDDDSGPSVFAAGNFTSIGGTPANGIARWDGQQWNALGNGLGPATTINLGGRSMAVFDDGSGPALFAGGHFHTTHGGPGNGLAKWDGASWQHIATPAAVNLLAVLDAGEGPYLYAIGISSAFPFSRWNNPGWTTLAPAGAAETSMMKPVATPMGPRLVISGHQLWDGQALAHFPGGALRSGAYPTFPYNGFLADADVVDFGSGPEMIVIGSFNIAGEVGSYGLARNDGTQWLPIGLGISQGTNNSPSMVTALAVHDDGEGPRLYAGGNFGFAGGHRVDSLARFDGNGWTSLNPLREPNLVRALHSWNDGSGPALFAAFQSGLRRHQPGQHIDIPVPGQINTLRVLDLGHGPTLVAAGEFIGSWNGAAWDLLPMPVGLNSVSALALFDEGDGPMLYVGGLPLGGSGNSPILRWSSDALAWESLPGVQAQGRVNALHVHTDGFGEALYIGGRLSLPGSSPVHITRWNRQFHILPSLGSEVFALTSFGSGRNATIYAGVAGYGAVNHRSLVRLNGNVWQEVLGPVAPTQWGSVFALQPFVDEQGTPSLFIGGQITSLAGMPSYRIAQYIGCPTAPPICYANCDGSTAPPLLNIEDFICFLNRFAEGTTLPHAQQLVHYANCDGSTLAPVLNVDDFTCFLDRFMSSMPNCN